MFNTLREWKINGEKVAFGPPTNPVRPKEYMILFFFTFDIYNLLESVVYLPLFSYFKIKHVV